MTPPPPPPNEAETIHRLSLALNTLAAGLNETIRELTGEQMAFCLVVFTGHRMQYVSNADREQVADALETLLKNWRAGLPDVPAHELQ